MKILGPIAPSLLISVKELAEELSVSNTCIQKHIKKGHYQWTYQPHNRVKILRSSVKSWADKKPMSNKEREQNRNPLPIPEKKNEVA